MCLDYALPPISILSGATATPPGEIDPAQGWVLSLCPPGFRFASPGASIEPPPPGA